MKVWQKGMGLVSKIYQVTQDFPKEEKYGLTDQMRRSAVSIPLNIAEGMGRFHRKEYIQFLFLSRGSAYDLITLLKLSENLKIITSLQAADLLAQLNEVTAMLHGLIKSLK